VAEERHDAAFIVGAVVGGLAAGAYALFAAPQAGSQTRAQLRERGDADAERVARTTAEVDERVRRWLARADEQAAPLRRRLTGDRDDRGSAPVAAFGTERGSVVETEPFITLPDPLEPDPVAAEAAGPAASGTAGDLTVDVPRVTNAPQ